MKPRRPLALVAASVLGALVLAEHDAGSASASVSPTVLSMPRDAKGSPGTLVEVPILASPADGILGIDLRIRYDPAVLEARDVRVSGLAADAGFALFRNLSLPGVIVVSTYATGRDLAGSGEIARIEFRLVGGSGSSSSLTFSSGSVNEGRIPAEFANGALAVRETTLLSMPDDATGGPGATVQVPVSAMPADGILGIDLTIQYDPAVIRATDVVVSGIAASARFALVRNVATPGVVMASIYATENAMAGSGEIARIEFDTTGSPGAASPLTFVQAVVNEGAIPALVDGGLFSVTCAAAAEGTSCTDGNGCTADDRCTGGVCIGTAIAAPGEITGAGIGADKATIVWNPVGASAYWTVYDVVRGRIGQLPVGPGGGDESCVASGIAETNAADAEVPPPAAGVWYLVRGRNSCGEGTYGFAFRAGAPAEPRASSTCP